MTTRERSVLESDERSSPRNAPQVVIPHGSEKTRSELNAAKVVEFLGGEVTFVPLPVGGVRWMDRVPPGTIVIADAVVLASAMPEGERGAEWLSDLTATSGGCFMFGFRQDAGCERLLHVLTAGGYQSSARPGLAGRFEVANERSICRQLSGLSFEGSAHESDGVFLRTADRTDCVELIRFNDKPLVLAATQGARQLLVAAEVADLDEIIEHRAPMASRFSRLAPLLIFLRWLCGDSVWHGDCPRACLILDDPLLKPRYGFLDFEELLARARTANFSANIAFIPWNHRRSDARVAELFKRFPSKLSLSIHGCEHTGAEFASADVGFLRDQASLGLRWMKRHRALTGVSFDEVMVFPQGRFSKVAMTALQSCSYLAAVNSTGRPVDAEREELRLRDLLEVAITRFDGFPLFVRHYPKDIPDLAIDLFLGKPALVVEHHGFFKDGYGLLEEIVGLLNRLEPRLEWTNLSTICSNASSLKRGEDGDWKVRFYTDRFRLTNASGETRRYALMRRQTHGRQPTGIELDSGAAETTQSPDGSSVSVELAPGNAIGVGVLRISDSVAHASFRRGFRWRARVFVRRHLSEFRDNHVDRNPFLKRMESRVRQSLGARK